MPLHDHDYSRRRFCVSVLVGSVGLTFAGAAPALDEDLDEARFAAALAREHGFGVNRVMRLLRQAKVQPAILRAIGQPGLARPWFEYRDAIISDRRIVEGANFWQTNGKALGKAEREYGVPAAIIVATLGVETFYGRDTGRFRVLDALYTLAFHYPKRAAFFQGELAEFIMLTTERGLDPLKVKGSFAGAMGLAQFMPSSYRKYAVDLDGDRRPNLWREADAIGSVANYYHSFDWQPDAPVLAWVAFDDPKVRDYLNAGIKPSVPLEVLKSLGMRPATGAPDEALATVLEVETESGPAYVLGFDNFYVITRYNRSVNYALSVYALARAIEEERAAGNAKP